MSQTSMSAGKDKMVMVKIKNIGKIKSDKNVEDGKGAADMAGAGLVDHIQNIQTKLFGSGFEVRINFGLKKH